MTGHDYVHGYSSREQARLGDQASTLAELLHDGTQYPRGSHVLEAGCGVGSQTVILAARSPQAHITSMDVSLTSLAAARRAVERAGLANVTFQQADIFALPFPAACFDHVFVCFVLEHLARPLDALACLLAVLKPGGSLTVIEGDHESAYYHPRSRRAQRTIDCLIEVQARLGGDSLIGRRLYPLLRQAGLRDIHVEPRVVYADASRPAWVEGFTRNTFIAMVEGARDHAIAMGLIGAQSWRDGIADLTATAGDDGTFSYTFFKAHAVK